MKTQRPDALWTLDATAQAALVASGEVSASELLEVTAARIERIEPKLGALACLDMEAARTRAAAPLQGRFAGVPFLTKDLLAQPGLPCAFGTRIFRRVGFVPPAHVPYTEAIERAGLVTLGKTTTSEFGLLGSTEAAVYGATKNPWDPTRSAGGSSGGAAAAVAAGLVPMAHASDGGGSIRIPAALCGLFGFKPSAHRCVTAVAVENDFAGLTSEHCVSRSVRDSAGFLACTERADAEAPHSPVGMVEPGDLGRLTIGVLRSNLFGEPHAAAGAVAVERAASLCASLGHEVRWIDPPRAPGEDISRAFFTVAGAAVDGASQMIAGMLGRAPGPEELEPFTLELLRWYRTLPADALSSARDTLTRVAEIVLEAQRSVDVTLSPTIGVPSPTLGFLSPALDRATLIERTERFAAYTPAHNIAGACAMSVPLHMDDDGMPVGCHFAAMPGDDARLLRLAYQLEEAAPWSERWPPLAL